MSAAPSPAFLDAPGAARRAAADFLRELGVALPAALSAGAPAPSRVFLVIDALDLVAPDAARRLIETAARRVGPGTVVLAAGDLRRLGDDPRQTAEDLFDLVFDVSAGADAEALARRLFGEPAPKLSPAAPPATSVLEPLEAREIDALTRASALVGPGPRALKRYFNAYRLARTQAASRPALALALAAAMSQDGETARAWRDAAQAGRWPPTSSPPALAAALAAADLQTLEADAAATAWAAARRYAPGRD